MITYIVPVGIKKFDALLCGCGDPPSVWALVIAELERCGTDGESKQPPRDDGYHMLLMYLLDYVNVTEHGGNVRWAWLTPDGHEALAFLRQYGAEWKETPGVSFEDDEGATLNPMNAE